MSKLTWHKAPRRLRDHRYLALTAAQRGVLAGLDELFADEAELVGSVTTLSSWLGLGPKRLREALQAIAEAELLQVRWDGVFHLTRPPLAPDTSAARPPRVPRSSPARPPLVPKESAHDAALPPASLNRREEKRPEETRGGVNSSSPLLELSEWWQAVRGKAGPISSTQLEVMREALALPGMDLASIKAFVDRGIESRRKAGHPDPTAFHYFISGLREESKRKEILANPGMLTPQVVQARDVLRKPRIQDADHYRWLILQGFDLEDFANPDEFREAP